MELKQTSYLFIYLLFSTRVLKKSIDSLWKVCNKCEGDINCAVFTVFTVSAVIFFLSHLFCKILKGYEGLEYWTEKRKQTCSHKGPITCITFCLWLRMKCSWKNKQTNKQKNSWPSAEWFVHVLLLLIYQSHWCWLLCSSIFPPPRVVGWYKLFISSNIINCRLHGSNLMHLDM